MNEENLYQYIKGTICDRIFEGVYQEGERIPSERILAEELSVSRVTLRKSLEILEKDMLVVREVGVGTRVCLHNYGIPGSMDMIVLIAPAKNPFFSDFIVHFQSYMQGQDSMVLYVEKPEKETLENCLYRLYKKGLKNVVIWLEDIPVDQEKLKRLRALGMNMVFFDTDKGLPYGDCVVLNNQLAVGELCSRLRIKGCKNLTYIGWDKEDVYSIKCREQFFIDLEGEKTKILRLPWKDRDKSRKMIQHFLEQTEYLPDGIICGDRETGRIVSEVCSHDTGNFISIASIDDFKEASDRNVIIYTQDLEASVAQIGSCLKAQNQEQSRWSAKIYRIQGHMQNE